MYDLPTYVSALVLIAAIGFPVITGLALYRSALAAGIGRGTAVGVAVATAVVLGGWLVVSGMLARDGVYRQDPGEAVPWLPVAFAGFLVALLLATRIPLVSRILADPGAPARLVLPHALRVVGVVFLIVMAQGHLPAAFPCPRDSATLRSAWPPRSLPGSWLAAPDAPRRCGSTSLASSI